MRCWNAPGKTGQDVTGKKYADVDCKEHDENEAYDGEEGADHGPSVANPLRNDAVEKQTHNLGTSGSIAESFLPRGRDLVDVNAVLDPGRFAKLFGECRLAIEAAEQPGVVALHDDGERQTEGEEDGHGVEGEVSDGVSRTAGRLIHWAVRVQQEG